MTARHRVLVIHPEGRVETRLLGAMSWHQLAVGVDAESVELIRLSHRLDLWHGDDALVEGKPLNRVATLLVRQVLGKDAVIAGPAMVTGAVRDGDPRALTDADMAYLTPLLRLKDRRSA